MTQIKTIDAGTYSIYFENTRFSHLRSFLKRKKYSRYFILCDENTMQYCLPELITAVPELSDAHVIEIESGESAKSLEIATQIWNCLLDDKADRQSLLINLGGGVVTDLGGFCAAVFKRGINFIHIPTTVLAMADAGIGTKTGIDFGGIKNSIGSFTAPQAVFISFPFLQTLPPRHLLNGLAEIYKIALVGDRRFWSQLQSSQMKELVYKSIALKNKIVLKDPLEKNLRKILNFGHSAGHALEAFALSQGIDLLHGEAIVAGMVIETHIAWQKKLITADFRDEIVFVLSSWFDLPELNFSFEDLQDYLLQDKKNTKGEIQMALVNGPGKCLPATTCNEKQIRKAISFYQDWLDD